uniref:G-protein coupled receptors family 1 profile domain-containing protein n=1 Tax=Acrobeloides nanus TaxID=290746 RepID=A0A914CJE3_9BILA
MQCMHKVSDYNMDTLYGFNLFHVLTTFYVPLIIIVVSYSLIGLSLRKQIVRRAKLRRDASKISTFAFTWLPYQILALLQVLCAESTQCQDILSHVYWLEAIMIASTCINPFLYKFNTRQKRAPMNGNSSFGESDRMIRSQATQSQTKTSYVTQTFDSHTDRATVVLTSFVDAY